MDASWRALERAWRKDPADQDLLTRAIVACRRAGAPAQADLLEAVVHPARRRAPASPGLRAELPGGRVQALEPGARVPPHALLWGVPQQAELAGVSPAHGDEAIARTLARSPRDPARRFTPMAVQDPAAVSRALGRLLSRAARARVHGLRLAASAIGDADLARVADALPGLLALDASQCLALSPAALPALARLERLQRLDLSWDAPLAGPLGALGALPELLELELRLFAHGSTRIDARDLDGLPVSLRRLGLGHALRPGSLRPLARLGDLEKLALTGVELDDAALEPLAALPRLRRLDLGGSRLGDAGLRRLAGALPELRALDLAGCERVGDRGLAALAAGGAPLEQLVLDDCRGVSNKGLRALAAVPTLRRVSLLGSARFRAALREGRQALAAALPGCWVVPG